MIGTAAKGTRFYVGVIASDPEPVAFQIPYRPVALGLERLAGLRARLVTALSLDLTAQFAAGSKRTLFLRRTVRWAAQAAKELPTVSQWRAGTRSDE